MLGVILMNSERYDVTAVIGRFHVNDSHVVAGRQSAPRYREFLFAESHKACDDAVRQHVLEAIRRRQGGARPLGQAARGVANRLVCHLTEMNEFGVFHQPAPADGIR